MTSKALNMKLWKPRNHDSGALLEKIIIKFLKGIIGLFIISLWESLREKEVGARLENNKSKLEHYIFAYKADCGSGRRLFFSDAKKNAFFIRISRAHLDITSTPAPN